MSRAAKWIWNALTPASVPAGARISAGKFGSVARSFPSAAVASVNRPPARCIPSPGAPAKRTITLSRSSTRVIYTKLTNPADGSAEVLDRGPLADVAGALQPGRVAHRVAGARALAPLPPRAALVAPGRVEPAAVHDHVDVAGVGVDGDPVPRARRAPALEVARGERAAEQAGAVQGEGHRARAVVAVVVPLSVAAAVLVREVGDAVGGGDHAPHPDRQASARARAQMRALEDDTDVRVAERRPCRRPDDPVGMQSVVALEALDGPRGRRAEDAVGADSQGALEDDHVVPARRHPGAFGARAARVRAFERRPGGRPDDPVGMQPVAALEALDGAARRRAVDAVDVEVQPLLHRRDAGAARADLEHAGVCRDGDEQRDDGGEQDDAGAPCARGRSLCVPHRSRRPEVGRDAYEVS